jgi:anti-anti-sigma regulatory factor
LYDALKLRERIASLLDGGRSIVVDLTETLFVDSSIVGVLLDAKRLAADRGADYSVVLRTDDRRARTQDVRDDRARRDPAGRRARRVGLDGRG